MENTYMYFNATYNLTIAALIPANPIDDSNKMANNKETK